MYIYIYNICNSIYIYICIRMIYIMYIYIYMCIICSSKWDISINIPNIAYNNMIDVNGQHSGSG